MHRRTAFTLVELLVAMALIVFMMVILAEAFSVGLESFRRLKAIGDMNARMRTAVTALQTDLQADHFEGKRRLSDPNFWTSGPPQQGFFRLWHGSPLMVEDADAGGDQIPCTRANSHILHFAVKKRGNERGDFFLASVPPGSPLSNLGVKDARYQDTPDTYTSQWAEVAYFLRRNGEFAGSTPLYSLYRRQKLLVPLDDEVNRGASRVPDTQAASYLEVSATPQAGLLYFNGPMDVAMPARRFGMLPADPAGRPIVRPGFPGLSDPSISPSPNSWTYPTVAEESSALAGADLLLPDVISFEVTVLVEGAGDFVDLYDAGLRRFDRGNPQFQGNNPHVFDTWTNFKDDVYDYSTWDRPGQAVSIPLFRDDSTTPPTQLRIIALRITLRVWDAKTGQTRQQTLIQDM